MPESRLKATEEWQEIKNVDIKEDIEFDPPSAFRWFISNLVHRVFAFLFGWDGKKPVRVKVSPAGEVYTRAKPVAYIHNKVFYGTVTGTTPVELVFPEVCARVDVFIYDSDAYIERSVDGVVYEDAILVLGGMFYSFDADTKSVKVYPKVSTDTVTYQVIGWY